jgi:hypothetical protein
MSRIFLRRMMEILQRYGLLSTVTEEMIIWAALKLRQEQGMSSTSSVFLVLSDLLESDRVVERYDPEIDNCEEGALIIQQYARATAGEWVPSFVRATSGAQMEERWTEAIDFDYHGTTVHWEFLITDCSGEETCWDVTFYQYLEQFFQQHLVGDFFHPNVYEVLLAYYLPVQAVVELQGLEEDIENEYGLEGFTAFLESL